MNAATIIGAYMRIRDDYRDPHPHSPLSTSEYLDVSHSAPAPESMLASTDDLLLGKCARVQKPESINPRP